MICGDCGETNKPGTEFCLFCGAYQGWQDHAPGADDVTEVLPVQPAQETRPTQPARTTPSPSPSPVEPVHQPMSAPTPVPTRAPSVASSPGPPSAPTTSAIPTAPATPLSPVVAAAPSGCPRCGRPLEPARRFCGHCGEQLIHPGTNAPVARSRQRSTWWSRLWDSRERVARRAYRRSLPPLYRWRRVIIAVLAVALVGGGATVVGRSPKAFVLARYNDVRNVLVPVTGVTAETIPPDASGPDVTPQSLVDATAKAWQMPWTATTQGSPCDVAPTTPVIQLSFSRTRIRQLDLRAGLLDNNANRLLQYRPRTVWIAYADQCQNRDLADVERQTVALDTGVPVESIRIGVQTAFPPDQPTGGQDVLSLTEITLLSRPPVR